MDVAILVGLGMGAVIVILLFAILQRLAIISAQIHANNPHGLLIDVVTNFERAQDRLSSIRSSVDQVEATLCNRLPLPGGIERHSRP